MSKTYMLITYLKFILIFFSYNFLYSENIEVLNVEKYQIDLSTLEDKYLENVDLGSGLVFKKRDRRGRPSFYILNSFYGPLNNFNDPASFNGAAIAELQFKGDKLKVKRFIPLSSEYKKNASKKRRKKNGFIIDPEGLTVTKNKGFYVVEESNPSILHFNKSGKLVNKFLKKDLPVILNQNEINRGLEGISILPNGNLLLLMQSLPKNHLSFIPVVKFDPKTKESEIYKIRTNDKETKLGGIQAIDENRFLFIYTRNNKSSIIISDLREVEDGFLKLKKIVNLSDYGWDYLKTEGITISEDANSIIISNDDERRGANLWIFNLKESLLPWRFSEWLLFYSLIFIITFSFVFMFMAIFNKKKLINE